MTYPEIILLIAFIMSLTAVTIADNIKQEECKECAIEKRFIE